MQRIPGAFARQAHSLPLIVCAYRTSRQPQTAIHFHPSFHPHTLLALSNDVEAPEDADFLAATNQLGSGTESEIDAAASAANAVIESISGKQVGKFVDK